MTFYAREHTDPAGGALTITTDHQGTWVTATEGREEVTVGPFPASVLDPAVPDPGTDEPVDPEGDAAYWRARAEEALAALSETEGRVTAARERTEGIREELRNADQHILVERARAERAEQERDGWKRRAGTSAATSSRLLDERDDARREVLALRAEQPRTLTPDEQMVTRFMLHEYGVTEQQAVSDEWAEDRSTARESLTAALTEPPTRPEGAEEIEAAIREVVPSHPEDRYGDLANRLAERGVRVTGADS